jgi:hypothetical protein
MLSRPRERHFRVGHAIAEATLGAALVATGELSMAETMLRAAWMHTREATGNPRWILNHVAFLLSKQGRIEDAARVLGHFEATASAETLAHSPSQRRSYDAAKAIVCEALDAASVKQLQAQGAALTEDQVVALALPS